MANPQPDKHTQISNELLDIIPYFKLNGAQLRIIMVVWRNTYGWKRKDHDLSITFIHERTGLSESAVKKEVAALLKSNVLLVTKSATHHSARKLSFNKDYEAWTIPKSGESMSDEMLSEGHDCVPLPDDSGGHDCVPLEGDDCTPQVITQGVTIVPPNKESLLKKSFKENVELFQNFYVIYPRKVSRHAAMKAWTKLCKEEEFDAELVIQNTMNFAETHKMLQTSKLHIPHPSTYLNQKRYEDYGVVDPEDIAAEKQSKFGSNLDFLKDQIGGGQIGQETGGIATGESIGCLPEQGSRFEE